MATRRWVIGSDGACDIVVEHPAVSRRHCELIREGTAFRLRDLGSTNGTYVNGRRIEGTVIVRRGDAITLGTSQPLPWPRDADSLEASSGIRRTAQGESRRVCVITIGRRRDNDVVLSEPNISSIHARLVISEEEMVVEDLGSTNGTAVDEITNKVSRAVVTPETMLYFGSTPYLVADLIAKATGQKTNCREHSTASLPEASMAEVSSHAPVAQQWTRAILLLVPIGLLVLLLGALAYRWTGGMDAPHSGNDRMAPGVPRDSAVSIRERPSSEGHQEGKKDPNGRPHSDAEVGEDLLAESLFVVACANEDRSEAFRLGTAFAIESRHLVTAASVVQLLREYQAGEYPQAIVYHPQRRKSYSIASLHVHPRFLEADAEASSAREEHDAIQARFESSPDPAQAETVKQKLMELRTRAIKALAQRTTYDIAVIELSEATPARLALSGSATRLRPKQQLEIAAYAIDREDLFFDPEYPIKLHVMAARVDRLDRVAPSVPPMLVAACSQHQLAYNYLGGPILDARHHVVAVYVRPSPPIGDGNESELPRAADACLIDRVQEIPGVRLSED